MNIIVEFKRFSLSFFLLLISVLSCKIIFAQNYSLDELRRNNRRNIQLLTFSDSTNSYTVLENKFFNNYIKTWHKPSINILPLVLFQQFNSNSAYGWNDGPMQQLSGYQLISRPGINFRFGIFESQIAPEFLFTSSNSYTKVFSGQSFFKAHLGPISFGVSSENLWWGPGINSSLLLSNSAPGFLHGFLGTNKPFKTPIGNIEFKVIGGKLNSDKRLSYENYHNRFQNINDDWRYLNSYIITWQPKWVKGLFLGMTRSLQQYGAKVQSQNKDLISKYLPVLGLALQKKNNMGDDSLSRDQLASVFLRWVLPKSNAEFYLEFGKNDYGVSIRDYLMAPTHSFAYTVGFRKILPKTVDKYVQIETELTKLSQSPDRLVRNAGNWYEHSQIIQGYTNHNQILGAGAGFGANVQTASATWINGDIRNGFLVQRVERDPEGRVNKWTDLSIGWMPQWKYKNMLLGAKVQLIRSNNYNWEKGNHSFNLHSRLMIQYNFK